MHYINPLPPYERLDEMDKPHEECGVFGVYAPGEDVARITFFALYALQHRGTRSAGIATSDGEAIASHTSLGLVSQAFDEEDLKDLSGFMAIGHTRYSTAGSNSACNAGPMRVQSDLGELAISHNGNLTNALALRLELEREGEISKRRQTAKFWRE
jgi:amidophosphoribosyltransferase